MDRRRKGSRRERKKEYQGDEKEERSGRERRKERGGRRKRKREYEGEEGGGGRGWIGGGRGLWKGIVAKSIADVQELQCSRDGGIIQ